LLFAGFLAPLAYLFGLMFVTGTATKALPRRALGWLPVVLATMHVCWGIGFLTSPRHLVPGLGGSSRTPTPAQKGAAA